MASVCSLSEGDKWRRTDVSSRRLDYRRPSLVLTSGAAAIPAGITPTAAAFFPSPRGRVKSHFQKLFNYSMLDVKFKIFRFPVISLLHSKITWAI
jgi:hypothetical protein